MPINGKRFVHMYKTKDGLSRGWIRFPYAEPEIVEKSGQIFNRHFLQLSVKNMFFQIQNWKGLTYSSSVMTKPFQKILHFSF